jgi:dTMP kinase
MFIAVDGIDGAGKTTLANQLAGRLVEWDPLITKEPTNASPWGRRLRESAQQGRLPRNEEVEYFHKDRLWHLANVIEPALEAGRVVISDRYVDSTLAFQANSPDEADALYESFVREILVPNITLILSCPVEVGLERIHRNRGRLTKFEDLETLARARMIYETRSGSNYCIIDASGTVEQTFRDAVTVLRIRAPSLFSLEDCNSELENDPFSDQKILKTAAGT